MLFTDGWRSSFPPGRAESTCCGWSATSSPSGREGKGTDLSLGARPACRRSTKRRTVAFLISDFLARRLREAPLRTARMKHDLVPVVLRRPDGGGLPRARPGGAGGPRDRRAGPGRQRVAGGAPGVPGGHGPRPRRADRGSSASWSWTRWSSAPARTTARRWCGSSAPAPGGSPRDGPAAALVGAAGRLPLRVRRPIRAPARRRRRGRAARWSRCRWTAQVTPEAVRLGDPFDYRITVHHPPAQRWELRTPARPRRLRAARPEQGPRRRQGGEHHHVRAPDVALRAGQPRAPHPHLRRGRAAGRRGGTHRRRRTSRRRAACRRTPTSSAPSSRTSSPTRTCRSAAGGCSGGSWGWPAVAALAWLARRAWLRRPRRLAPATPPLPLEERTRAALDALEPRDCPSAGCSASSTSGSRAGPRIPRRALRVRRAGVHQRRAAPRGGAPGAAGRGPGRAAALRGPVRRRPVRARGRPGAGLHGALGVRPRAGARPPVRVRSPRRPTPPGPIGPPGAGRRRGRVTPSSGRTRRRSGSSCSCRWWGPGRCGPPGTGRRRCATRWRGVLAAGRARAAERPAPGAPPAPDGGGGAGGGGARPAPDGGRAGPRPLGGGDRHHIALDLSTSMEAGDFRPQNRTLRGQGGAERVHRLAGQRPDRAGGVRRRRLHPGAAHARLRGAPRGGEAAADPGARGRHRHRRRARGGAQPAARLGRQEQGGGAHHRRRQQRRAASRPLDAAAMAKALHIPVFTILVGKGGKVPFPDGTDLFGNPSYRELEIAINPELLQEISADDRRRVLPGDRSRVAPRGAQRHPGQAGARASSSRAGRAPTTGRSSRPSSSRRSSSPRLELLLRSTVLRVFP